MGVAWPLSCEVRSRYCVQRRGSSYGARCPNLLGFWPVHSINRRSGAPSVGRDASPPAVAAVGGASLPGLHPPVLGGGASPWRSGGGEGGERGSAGRRGRARRGRAVAIASPSSSCPARAGVAADGGGGCGGGAGGTVLVAPEELIRDGGADGLKEPASPGAATGGAAASSAPTDGAAAAVGGGAAAHPLVLRGSL